MLAAFLLVYRVWVLAIAAAPAVLISPVAINQAHAVQCTGFNLVQNVVTSFTSTVYTFNALRVITFSFDLTPSGSASISFLGTTQSRTNTGAATQNYTISFTVPNTGPTSSGSFVFTVTVGPSVTFTGSCTGGTAGGTTGTGTNSGGTADHLLEQHEQLAAFGSRGPDLNQILDVLKPPVGAPGENVGQPAGQGEAEADLLPPSRPDTECGRRLAQLDEELAGVQADIKARQAARARFGSVANDLFFQRLNDLLEDEFDIQEAIVALEQKCPGARQRNAAAPSRDQAASRGNQNQQNDQAGSAIPGVPSQCEELFAAFEEYERRGLAGELDDDEGTEVEAALVALARCISASIGGSSTGLADHPFRAEVQDVLQRAHDNQVAGQRIEEVVVALPTEQAGAILQLATMGYDGTETPGASAALELLEKPEFTEGLSPTQIDQLRQAASSNANAYHEMAEAAFRLRDAIRAAQAGGSTSNYLPEPSRMHDGVFRQVLDDGTVFGFAPTMSQWAFGTTTFVGDPNAPRPWVVQLSSSVTGIGETGSSQNRDSVLFNASINASVQWDSLTSFGVTGTFKTGTTQADSLNTELDGNTAGITVSMSRQLAERMNLNVATSFNRGEYDLNAAGVTSSFDADIFQASAQLTGSQDWDGFTITNNATINVSSVRRDGYTDSAGTVVPANSFTNVNTSIGSSIARAFEGSGMVVSYTPTLGVDLGHKSRSENFQLSNGAVSQSYGLGATANAGMEFELTNGARAGFSGSYGLHQRGPGSWSVTGHISIPLN